MKWDSFSGNWRPDVVGSWELLRKGINDCTVPL